MLRDGRTAVPAKITSSISPPRKERAELSPMAQRSASTTFDLPQPFGPTMPVRPGRISITAGSAKLLKPTIRSRAKLTGTAALSGGPGHEPDEPVVTQLAGTGLAVGDEGRGRVDVPLALGPLLLAHDELLQLLVGDGGLERLARH